MKSLVISWFWGLLIAALPLSAEALEFRVVGRGGQVLYSRELPPVGSVGQLTDQTLRAALASGELHEYLGDETGVESIENLGTWTQVLGPVEYKAYGWCYQVDGLEPALPAGQFMLLGQERLVEWWYAFGHYRDGRWISMCEAAR